MTENLAFLDAAHDAAEQTSDPQVRAYIDANAIWLLTAAGDPNAATMLRGLRPLGESVDVTRQRLRALNNAADCALDVGHYTLAHETVARALEFSNKHDYARFVPYLERIELRARWWMGQVEGIAEEVARLRAEAHSGGQAVLFVDGELLFAQGRLDDAHAALVQVLDDDLHQGAVALAARAGAAVVRIALASGKPAEADAVTQRVIEAVAESEIWLRAAPLLPFAPLERIEAILSPAACRSPARRSGRELRDQLVLEGRQDPADPRLSRFPRGCRAARRPCDS